MGRRVQVIESDLGLLTVTWPEKAWINPDGTLNEYRVRRSAWLKTEHRVDGTREMEWYGIEKENAPASPFLFGRTKFNLRKKNELYIPNLKKIIDIHHEFDRKYIHTVFDGNSMDYDKTSSTPDRRDFYPWSSNVQGIGGPQKSKARTYVENHLVDIVETNPDGIYIFNEPGSGTGEFIIFCYETLIGLGYPVRKIITGIQWYREDEPKFKQDPYWTWKQYRKTHGGDKLKKNIMLARHGFGFDNPICDGLLEGHFGSRRAWLSRDGVYPRPPAEKNKQLLNGIKNTSKHITSNEWHIEALCNEYHGGHGNEGEGFADALNIKYKKYPEPVEPQPSVVVPEPTPEPEGPVLPVKPEPEGLKIKWTWQGYAGIALILTIIMIGMVFC